MGIKDLTLKAFMSEVSDGINRAHFTVTVAGSRDGEDSRSASAMASSRVAMRKYWVSKSSVTGSLRSSINRLLPMLWPPEALLRCMSMPDIPSVTLTRSLEIVMGSRFTALHRFNSCNFCTNKLSCRLGNDTRHLGSNDSASSLLLFPFSLAAVRLKLLLSLLRRTSTSSQRGCVHNHRCC